VPADPVKIRSFSHGILPAALFSFFDAFLHAPVVFAGGAVIKIIAVFKIDHARLHPEAWVGDAGVLVRFYHPDLAPQNRADFFFIAPVGLCALSIR
jgi:hypothetical protein